MTKQNEQNMPKVSRQRKLAALISVTHRSGGESKAPSCYTHRCEAASMVQSLKHYA